MPWDFVLLILLLGVFIPWRSLVRMRQLLRTPATTSQQRLLLYASTMAGQWLIAGIALWRALARGITPRLLGLALDAPLPALAAAAAMCAVLAALQIYGLRQLARLPEEQQGHAGILARKLMPQNFAESLVFVALAASVAICEEFLYRGFLLAALQRWAGALLAAGLVSTLLFAIAHLYQGARGVVSTFFLGLLLCALRLTSGSLVPCVVIHFGVDLVAGLAAPRLLSPANERLLAVAGASPASDEEKMG